MSLTTPSPLVHLHADLNKEAGPLVTHVQIKEPEPDDAAASPSLFEALEQALWQGAQDDAEPMVGAEVLLAPGLDVDEVLHPVAGIELDI